MKGISPVRLFWLCLHTWWQFWWVIFTRIFQGNRGNSAALAGDGLLHGTSYELRALGYIIIPKTFGSLLKLVFRNSSHVVENAEGKPGVSIYDARPEGAELRWPFIEFYAKEKPSSLFAQVNMLFSLNIFHKIIFLLFLPSFLLPSLLVGLFPKYRANAALWVYEYVRACNLRILARMYATQRIYYFCIYVKESNFCARLLMHDGVEVIKITSESPLTFFNRQIVANKVVLCIPYQKEELAQFGSTILTDSVEIWAPEQTLKHVFRYAEKDRPTPPKTLGLYTSGGWRRIERYDSDMGLGYHESEVLLHTHLRAYLEARPDVQLILFTHPIEKDTPERFVKAQTLYRDLIGERIQFAAPEVRTSQAFEQVDVAVSIFSVVMYDRLISGFKSVLAPYEIIDFPIPNTNLAGIAAKSESELFRLLDEALGMETPAWFEKKGFSDWIFNGDQSRYQ
ncbi:MAG TPA: hypothetical protein ENJ82_03995 [Bacteroidetes bacterium]|nr:hypothetical protein [Bacteroidota bacterium]